MIKILVDSSSDYTPEEIKEKNLELVPISIIFGDTSYIEGENLTRDGFFEKLTSGKEFPKTSQPSPQDFLNHFEAAKENGDEIICLLLSSALSGTYQSAFLAKNMTDYGGIYILDSLSATINIKIMADYALRLAAEGRSAGEIVKAVEELKPRVKVVAALDTLEYLHRGGRIGKAAALLGELASLKPVVTVTEEGVIGVLGKALGKNKAISSVLHQLESMQPDPDFPLYSLYSFGTDAVERFEKKLTDSGYRIDSRYQIGATIGTHIGPGAFGAVFVKKAGLHVL